MFFKKISDSEQFIILDREGFNKLCNKIVRLVDNKLEIYRKGSNQYQRKHKIRYLGNIYDVIYPYSEWVIFSHKNGDRFDFRDSNILKEKISVKDEMQRLAEIRYQITNIDGNFSNRALIKEDNILTERFLRLLGPRRFGRIMYKLEKDYEREKRV